MERSDPAPPERLARAVELVRSDLEAAGPTGISLACKRYKPGEWGYDPDFEWSVEVALEGRSGIHPVASLDSSWPRLLEDIADRLSEEYIDLLWEARPRCPLHEHPLPALAAEDGSVWACPAGSGWQRPIGTLSTDADYVAAVRRPPPADTDAH